nr:DUF4158 domain-containing protein [Anaerophilus nitritogenes]
MKRNWEMDELIENFTFLPNEYTLLSNKSGATRLGFAISFKFFQQEARFPNHKNEIPKIVISYIAKQLDLKNTLFDEYDWRGRSIKYHRAQIRDFFGFKETTNKDIEAITNWLIKQILYHDAEYEHLKVSAYARFRELQLEPPTIDRIDRMIKSAIYAYENQFFNETFRKLNKDSIFKIDSLLNDLTAYEESEIDFDEEGDNLSFKELRADPGRIGLESIFKEVVKLKTIQQLNLPENLFVNIPYKTLKKYKQRAVSEKLPELRRHPKHIRYTMLAAFFFGKIKRNHRQSYRTPYPNNS